MEENEKQGFWKGFFSAMAVCVVIALVAGMISTYYNSRSGVQKISADETQEETLVSQRPQVQKKLALLESYIDEYYLNDVDEQELEDYLYKGLVAGIDDPYAYYYNAEEYQSSTDSSNGSYCGIGATLSQNMTTGVITVVKMFDGSPSIEAGILPEDILYKIDDEDVTGQDLTLVVTKLKGEEGSDVTVTMLRGDEELDFTMTRKTIEIPTVAYRMISQKTGYIQITEFDEITTDQFHEALTDLQSQGMDSLIIDLRDNGGGRVDAVCEIADELLPEGLIVYTEYKNGTRQEETSDAACVDVPMAVLMNGNSASASEILAGALQDYGLATIVGTQSFGKGIVQSVIDLQDGTALKITTAKYFTPNGNNIHGVGITPDVEIDLSDEVKKQTEISFEEDVQLQKAIEVLQQ